MANLSPETRELTGELLALRREFHARPEPGFGERWTAGRIAAFLRDLGLEVREGVAETGVTALIRGTGGGKTLLLRADMDALPLEEQTGLPFASLNRGMMHACGHDAHMANLLTAARLLAEERGRLRGTVVFILQPCEEGAAKKEKGGAERMIEAGVLDNPRLDALFGLHVLPDLPADRVALRPGAMMASVAWIYVRVLGRAAHGAFPHQGVDAIVAAAHAVTQFQALISRGRDPGEKSVLTIGKVCGGVRSNVIAEAVDMEGTVRAFSEREEERILSGIAGVLRGIEAAFGVRASLDFEKVNPAVVNDPRLAAMAQPVLAAVLGAENVLPAEPLTIGEDFALYSRRLPALFFFLGVGGGQALHAPGFTVDEEALRTAPALLAAVAFAFLEQGGLT